MTNKIDYSDNPISQFVKTHGEGYPVDWKHFILHLGPTGEMHGDGDLEAFQIVKTRIGTLEVRVKELEGERDNAFAECRAIHQIEKERAIETMALKRKQKELEGELAEANRLLATCRETFQGIVEKHKQEKP